MTLLNGGVLVDRVRPIFSQRLLRTSLGGAVTAALPRAISRRLFDLSLRRIAGPSHRPSDEELAIQFELVDRGDGRGDGRKLLRHLIHYMKEREQQRDRWRGALLRHALPMQLLWGDHDPINPYTAVEEISRERPATRAVRIRGAGHYPQLECPEEVGRAILEFVAEHDHRDG